MSLWPGIIPLLQILPGNVELITAETFPTLTGWKQVSQARPVLTSGIKINISIRSGDLLFIYFTLKWILLILVYYRTKNLDISWEPRNRLFLHLSLWLAGFQQQERLEACFADCFSHAVAPQGSSRNSSVSEMSVTLDMSGPVQHSGLPVAAGIRQHKHCKSVNPVSKSMKTD